MSQSAPSAPETERPRASILTRLRTYATGAAMTGLGAFGLVAALTHHPLDPSWNVAAPGPVSNLAGSNGAITADLLLQSLGWAGLALCLLLLGWGLILLLTGPRGRGGALAVFRTLSGAAGLAGLATALAALPIPVNWPFAAGLGGVVGDRVLFALAGGLAALGLPGAGAVTATIGTAFAVLGTVFCFGLTARDLASAKDSAETGWVTARVWLDQLAGRMPRPWRTDAAEIVTPPAPDGRAETAPAFLKGERKAKSKPRAEPPAPADRVAPSVTVKAKKKPKPSAREAKEAQGALPFAESEGFKLPRLDLLSPAAPRSDIADKDALQQNAELLESVLADFGVKGEITQVRPGPVVTLYELEPAPGTKSARVIGLAEDIARSMSAVSARISVIPGRNAIGIELPNARRETVALRELLASRDYEKARARLPLVLGKDISGSPVIADLTTMPHLLVAGTTGSGKSVGLNAMILSLLYRLSPEQCRLILVDPKMLELSIYEAIPHLLTPVVTEPKKAVVALKWAVREMEDRYRAMSKIGVRNLAAYNARVAEAQARGESLRRKVQTGFDPDTGQPVYEEQEFDFEPLPMIVIVIDEMADLMLVAGKDVEAAVQRLAQMARAAGIHLIMATQRPSVDVITGTIKANFPTRISFQVTSKIDSRTILGEQGAEQLLGQGDMLYMAGGGRITRVHGAFVTDDEVEKVVAHLRRQAAPSYLQEVTEEPPEGFESPFIPGPSRDDAGNDDSSLYDKAVDVVLRDRRVSTSYIQRRLRIGYNRAASLIEEMEDQGVISAPNMAGKREILVPARDDP